MFEFLWSCLIVTIKAGIGSFLILLMVCIGTLWVNGVSYLLKYKKDEKEEE